MVSMNVCHFGAIELQTYPVGWEVDVSHSHESQSREKVVQVWMSEQSDNHPSPSLPDTHVPGI